MNYKEVKNNFAKFYLKDDVLYFVYNQDVHLNIDAAKQIVQDRLDLQNSTSFPVLCDIRGLKGADKDARDYLANEGSAYTKAVGLIIGSPALKIMTNFYLMVNRPTVPTKVFKNEADALIFLDEYKN